MRRANIKGDAGLHVKRKLINSAELINMGFMPALSQLLGSSDIETAKTWRKVGRHPQEPVAKVSEAIASKVVLHEAKQTMSQQN